MKTNDMSFDDTIDLATIIVGLCSLVTSDVSPYGASDLVTIGVGSKRECFSLISKLG